MGAGRSAAEIGDARGHPGRARQRSAPCAELLQHGVRRPGRVLRRGRSGPDRKRGPGGIPRTQRLASEPGRHDPCAAFGQSRGRPGSLRRDPGAVRAGRRAGARDRLPARRGEKRGRRQEPGESLPRIRGGARGAGIGLAVLEADSRDRAGGNPRPGRQRPGQRLAPLPDSGVPCLGPERVLPVGRRLRVPRPVAGRHGAGALRAAPSARASAAMRGPSVPGGRRPALVASPLGPGRAHEMFR